MKRRHGYVEQFLVITQLRCWLELLGFVIIKRFVV